MAMVMVEPLSEAEEAELRKVVEGMTPGPWLIDASGRYVCSDSAPGFGIVMQPRPVDALPIVALRNAAPRLLATIAELRKELKWRREDENAWKFVPDESGGHMLSVRTGDKWYPESFMSAQIANLRTVAEAAAWTEKQISMCIPQKGVKVCSHIEGAIENLRAALAKVRGEK